MGRNSTYNTKIISDFVGVASYIDYRYDVYDVLNNNCSIDYVESLDSFERVFEFVDNSSEGRVFLETFLHYSVSYGSIEFFLKSTNSSKGYWFNLSRFDYLNVFSFLINFSGLSIFNETANERITDIESNKWYKFKIDFDSSDYFY